MKKEIVQHGQTIYDLAVQHYGGIDGVFALCADNPDLVANWHDHPTPGTAIYIKSAPVNYQVVDYFAKNKVHPASIIAPVPIELPAGALMTSGGNYLVTNNNEPIIAQ